MPHPSLKQERERTRRMMMRVTSRGLKTSRIPRTSSTSSLAETVDSPPSTRRSLREILSVESAMQKPLRYSEVLISFTRDVQWTSFSEPRKFLLVLDPVVVGS
jgi:phosphomevalonate kinase